MEMDNSNPTPHNMAEHKASVNEKTVANKMDHGSSEMDHGKMNHKNQYTKLLWMMVLSFISMFILMYAMVDKLDNVVPNINQFYMAGLMAAPMLIIELLLMGNMYPDKKRNTMLLGAGVAAMFLFWFGIRKQTAVGDVQFLKSMIPHHAGAILMVKESNLVDPEVKKLGDQIIKAQNEEIAVMKAKIQQLENRK